MGGQGAESLHTHLHSLEIKYSGIPNQLDRLKHPFNICNIETAPQLLELRAEAKKRGEIANTPICNTTISSLYYAFTSQYLQCIHCGVA